MLAGGSVPLDHRLPCVAGVRTCTVGCHQPAGGVAGPAVVGVLCRMLKAVLKGWVSASSVCAAECGSGHPAGSCGQCVGGGRC